jgi:hypothetical protein
VWLLKKKEFVIDLVLMLIGYRRQLRCLGIRCS